MALFIYSFASSLIFAQGTLFAKNPSLPQPDEYDLVQIDPTANTFTGKLHGQLRTFRVRPSVEVTLNGIKAGFADLEPGMKVKVETAEPGVAARLSASGLRTRTTTPSPLSTMGTAPQPSRLTKADIEAKNPNGFPIGDIRKGTKISLKYLSGKWKHAGRIAQFSPDGENHEMTDADRLVIATPTEGGKVGEVLAIVPAHTAQRPFVFDADKDYPGIVLRINKPSGNPGKVEYEVKVLPPPQ